MGVLDKLFGQGEAGSPRGCQRCGKTTLGTDEFFAKAEEAGLVVDRSTGEVKARMGGFSMIGGMFGDVPARLEEQKRNQQEILDRLENQRAFRCRSCGRIYCADCLLRHAPDHPNGGKACPKCGNTFEVLS